MHLVPYNCQPEEIQEITSNSADIKLMNSYLSEESGASVLSVSSGVGAFKLRKGSGATISVPSSILSKR